MVVVEIRAFRNAWKVKLDEENNHISCLNFVYLSILIIDITYHLLNLVVIINVFYYVLFNLDIMIVRKEPLFDVNS